MPFLMAIPDPQGMIRVSLPQYLQRTSKRPTVSHRCPQGHDQKQAREANRCSLMYRRSILRHSRISSTICRFVRSTITYSLLLPLSPKRGIDQVFVIRLLLASTLQDLQFTDALRTQTAGTELVHAVLDKPIADEMRDGTHRYSPPNLSLTSANTSPCDNARARASGIPRDTALCIPTSGDTTRRRDPRSCRTEPTGTYRP